MSIENIPEIYIRNKNANHDLYIYDYKMPHDVVKHKVNLSMHMLSFLQEGTKQVHLAGGSVAVNKSQSLLIKKGNSLWTELLDTGKIYYCKLLFFSEAELAKFLIKHMPIQESSTKDTPYFVIENDSYITTYISSLSTICRNSVVLTDELLTVKFEEIMLYLKSKYGKSFEYYLQSLVTKEISSFRKTIESNVYSNLTLEEISFLCNMSLSTFKRYFRREYQVSPGRWLQDRRLQKAKEILEEGNEKPSEIYLNFGYSSLSNFSIAFKNKFGVSPKDIAR